jgi:hypothetical protein
MKSAPPLIILFSLIFLFNGCASFSPCPLNMTSAVSTPGSMLKDSISLFVRELGLKESERVFDCDIYSEWHSALSIAISNRSNSTCVFIPSSIPQYEDIENVLYDTDYDPLGRLIVWSIPWIISLVLHYPVYYGVAWPIIGLVDLNRSKVANESRTEYFNSISIKPTKLQPGQDIQGIVFVKRYYQKPLQISIVKNDSKIVFDVYPMK